MSASWHARRFASSVCGEPSPSLNSTYTGQPQLSGGTEKLGRGLERPPHVPGVELAPQGPPRGESQLHLDFQGVRGPPIFFQEVDPGPRYQGDQTSGARLLADGHLYGLRVTDEERGVVLTPGGGNHLIQHFDRHRVALIPVDHDRVVTMPGNEAMQAARYATEFSGGL